jgi:predicted nuclease with TOPRIM domain
VSSPTKLRQMAKELGWPPELEKAADQLQKLKRENAELREQVEHLIGMIEQLEGDLAHFATIEAFEAKKEAQP